ncbi:MAG: carbohydrate ABC transporter permease [Thermomicrobiales bacterium]|nr:carbohydrate ABC transporter permease [Thermomicrobiales bacterium]MCO5221115.1 carbohydrate ABC transporter permease [Thermomicrobiales bacterium]
MSAAVPQPYVHNKKRGHFSLGRILLYGFVTLTAIVWLVPLVGALYASLRPFADTVQNGFFSRPDTVTLDNYRRAWDQGDIARKYWNTALILVPALIFTLFFSSMVAFVCSRFSWRFNIFMLSLFTAGNLLPQQIIIQPLFQMYNRVPLPDWMSNSGKLNGSTWGIILIHIAFQSGFCTFVLSNYMKLLPKSLNEAARIDGASVWKQYWQIIMPLTLPALAALATLEFTWIYNDFFWAVVLEQQGADRPITSSLANLGGEFFTDDNLIAAASVFVALPTLVVYFALQRYFISGLTLGSEKG